MLLFSIYMFVYSTGNIFERTVRFSFHFFLFFCCFFFLDFFELYFFRHDEGLDRRKVWDNISLVFKKLLILQD